ncbi:MAG: sigma-70 family RNA polymerase sigma factor [Deltaproteobacteria bacterium]|nr:sigma-70 family RNA polymerase sigma factor [Deltaproteobacteria bacterium]
MFSSKNRKKRRFQEVAYPHAEFIYNMALYYTGNGSDAEDITQETFYRAFKNFDQLKDEKKCKYWLLSIMRNLFFRESARNTRKGEFITEHEEKYVEMLARTGDESRNPEALISEKNERYRMSERVSKIPEKYRTPLLLFYVEGMAYQEISNALEIPIGTVMSRISRGKNHLKKELLSASSGFDYGNNILKVDFNRPDRRLRQ